MGNGVAEIGRESFGSCGRLLSVYIKATIPPKVVIYNGYWDAFRDNAYGRKIYVPRDSVELYKSADGWRSYAEYIVGYDF